MATLLKQSGRCDPWRVDPFNYSEPDGECVSLANAFNRFVSRKIEENQSENISIVYAPVREISVEKDDTVQPGDVVGKVGNNANSRNPHVEAWKGDPSKLGAKTGGLPLQIQVALYGQER